MANKALFAQLKQKFTTDTIIKRNGGKYIKVSDFNGVQSFGNLQHNSLANRYTRLYSNSSQMTSGTGYGMQITRAQLYADYESMDMDAIVAPALDIICEEATQVNEMNNEVLSVRSSSENIQDELYNLFYNVLNVEFNLPMWIRTMLKYGDNFLALRLSDQFGVYGAQVLSVYEMTREEGLDANNADYIRFIQDPGIISGGGSAVNQSKSNRIYENYEIAHFRLLKDSNYLPYGRCLRGDSRVLTPSREIFIKDLKQGDKVWSVNIKTLTLELTEVLHQVCSGTKPIYKVTTKSGLFVEGSENHPVLVVTKGGVDYREIKDLKGDECIVTYEDDNINDIYYDEIESIDFVGEDLTYDIHVESENHNFIANGIVVHNSWIEPARKLFKSYSMLEDAAVTHRITKSAEKRVFYYNVGNLPPNEIDAMMQKHIANQKKTPLLDPATGQFNYKFNMMNLFEDFHIPVRGNDTTTRIDTAKGLEYTGMDDINYFLNKMLAALKVPKAFLNFSDELNGKSTLSSLSLGFSKQIEYVQRCTITQLNKIAQVHLTLLGYEDEDLQNFDITLARPSILHEQERIALLKEKVDLCNQMMEKGLLSTDWMYDNIFQMSEDQINTERDLVAEDVKRKFRYSQIETEGNDPSLTGVSYGTPHDLASIYKNNASGPDSVPDGYDEKKAVGRPVTHASIIGTDRSAMGRDPLGKIDMEDKYKKDSLKPNPRKGMYNEGLKKSDLDKIRPGKRINLFEKKEEPLTLLDERNIRDL